MRLIDADALPVLFDEEFKKTMKLISEGESHLDNLAEGFTEAYQVVLKQPTIEAEPKWIPCSQALPKKIGWYRITLQSMVDGHRCTDWGSYDPNFGWGSSGEVVAWMEEPEPYKGNERL